MRATLLLTCLFLGCVSNSRNTTVTYVNDVAKVTPLLACVRDAKDPNHLMCGDFQTFLQAAVEQGLIKVQPPSEIDL